MGDHKGDKMGDDQLQIQPAPRGEWAAALQLLFQPYGETVCKSLCVDILTRNTNNSGPRSGMEGLLVARNAQQQLTGAVMVYEAPGRMGTLHPPQTTTAALPGTAKALLSQAEQYIASLDLPVLQAVIPGTHATDALLLQGAGYQRIARLLLMVAPAGSFPSKPPQLEFSLTSYAPDRYQRFEQTVEATYQGSMDCPAVDGARQTADVLDGYRAAGAFRNDWWLLIQHQGRDAGVMLLSDFPQHQNAELAYMGVTPPFRGSGWGLQLTQYALWLAGQEGRQQMVLAVDEKNQPALDLYTTAGFAVWSDRDVYIKQG